MHRINPPQEPMSKQPVFFLLRKNSYSKGLIRQIRVYVMLEADLSFQSFRLNDGS